MTLNLIRPPDLNTNLWPMERLLASSTTGTQQDPDCREGHRTKNSLTEKFQERRKWKRGKTAKQPEIHQKGNVGPYLDPIKQLII